VLPALENPAADEHNTVSGIGLLRSFRLNPSMATEIEDRDVLRFVKKPLRMRSRALLGTKRTLE